MKNSSSLKKTKSTWLNYFRPNLFLKSYSDLNLFTLRKNGIRVLICDLDNTLAPHFTKFPSKKAKDFVIEVQKMGIKFVVVSNNSKQRVTAFCKLLKPDDFIWNAKKPLLSKIKNVIKKYDLEPEELIILGDQFITDVWAANRLGCKSILVLPVVDQSKNTESSFLIKILDKFIYQKLQHNNISVAKDDALLGERYVLL